MRRVGLLLALAAGVWPLVAARAAAPVPATPVITEPAADGQLISPYDVHMVTGPFVGAPGEAHVCTDWEIRTLPSDEVVWAAPCEAGTGLVHVHLGDGVFTGPLAGRNQLDPGGSYRLRVRFLGDAPPPGSSWSDWASRSFFTSAATAISPLVLADVSANPVPRWRDAAAADVVLPAAGSQAASLRLEASGVGTVLSFESFDGATNRMTNPAPLSGHGTLRVVVTAGASAWSLPESVLSFTDGSGEDRAVYLPMLTLPAGGIAAFWIGESGGAFLDATGGDPAAPPDFSTAVTEPPVPWAARQPGFRIERFATGLRLPVNIAFLPNPGLAADDPYFYVTELYGTIAVVTRSGVVSDYATNLLNFDPTGPFPGSGEKGVTGIVVEPASGDVFASSVFAVAGVTDLHFPEVRRFHSQDGGRTAASQTVVLQFPDEPLGASHQTSNLSFGPDGELYVHIGDGLLTSPAENLNSVRGKILRVNLDGSAPADNPFFDAADGLTPKDLVFAWGLRNPFGGAWREADGAHWEVENGPQTDRLAEIVAGRNYLWNGSDASMANFAAYLWSPAAAPVNIVFTQPSTFGGSGFPAEKMDHAFVTEAGPTYAPGPQTNGKRISEFVLDGEGNVVGGPWPLLEYVGAGRGTAVALAAGPDGLYFSDLYKDFGAANPTDAGASIFRVVWTGVVDFTADAASGPVPLSVRFHNGSQVPQAAAWHWDFGDGESSDEPEPVHVYGVPGTYDVRLTVTGSGGEAYRQKTAFVVAAPAERNLLPPAGSRPTPRVLPPH